VRCPTCRKARDREPRPDRGIDQERLAIVKALGDVLLATITRETIEGFQAKRKPDGVSNRTATWTWARWARS
jgi:hypothetical protein